MLHHISIPAENPRQVVEVLAKLLSGRITGFGPYRNSYIAWAGDEAGTAIEVYPTGTEMFPDQAEGQANFRHNPAASGFTCASPPAAVKNPPARRRFSRRWRVAPTGGRRRATTSRRW